MKKLITISFLCAALGLWGSLGAQASANMQKLTTIKVTVVIEKETIKAGPYARYAQSCLGVVAPLADKEFTRIKTAYLADNAAGLSLMGIDNDTNREKPGTTTVSHLYDGKTFPKITVDRMDSSIKSMEAQANEAAKAIFTLRKRRFDLITGEAGENVFGEGLNTAVAEMNRMEQEYLALFLGKQSTERTVKVIDVIPENGRLNYVICRFSDADGILPESDLTGRPIVLELRPENRAIESVDTSKKSKIQVEYIQVPDIVQCLLFDGNKEVTSQRLPIMQFGKTSAVPTGK